MNNRADVLTALLVLIPMTIGYIVGLRTPRHDKWTPRRHTRSHWKQ